MLDIRLLAPDRVSLAGRFDAAQVAKAEAVFVQVEGECVVDCKDLDYISSAGIGVLIATYKRLYDRGHKLTVVNLNPYIEKVFLCAGLGDIFVVQ